MMDMDDYLDDEVVEMEWFENPEAIEPLEISNHGYRIAVREEDGFDRYFVVEAYYGKNGELVAWTEEPLAGEGDTLDMLLDDLQDMRLAYDLPVLILDEDDYGRGDE